MYIYAWFLIMFQMRNIDRSFEQVKCFCLLYVLDGKIFKWQYFVCSSLHSMFFYAKKKKMARKGWLYYAILRNKSIWIKLKGMGENHTFIYTKKKRYRVIKIWCLFYGAILLGHYYTYCSLHTIIIIYMYVTKRNVSFYMC